MLHDWLSVINQIFISFFHLLSSLSSPLVASFYTVNNILGTMTLSKKFSLENYKAILFDHENEFREKRGDGQQGVLATIIKKIIAQSQGQLSSSDAGGLETVCWPLINRLRPNLPGPRKSKIGMAITRVSQLRMQLYWFLLGLIGMLGGLSNICSGMRSSKS